MRLGGIQKLTLLDYPGTVACTVFTLGCNMRCPFCHNALLVTKTEETEVYPEEVFFAFLNKRRGILDGVCVTGGEPLLQSDAGEFIAKIKALGYKVKLDTNGSFPDRLEEILKSGNVDYVAMDIKNSPEKYAMTIGLENYDLSEIEKSKNYLLENHVDYEFRTTIVREFHEPEDLRKIGEWIRGAKHYYLQNFEDHGTCIQAGLGEVDLHTLETMKRIAGEYVEHIEIRGIKE